MISGSTVLCKISCMYAKLLQTGHYLEFCCLFFFFLVINFLVQRMPNLLPDVPTVSIYLPVVDL